MSNRNKPLTSAQVEARQATWRERGRKDARRYAARRPDALLRPDEDLPLYRRVVEEELDAANTRTSAADGGPVDCRDALREAWRAGLAAELRAVNDERRRRWTDPKAREDQLRRYFTGRGRRPDWLDAALTAEYDDPRLPQQEGAQ